MFTGFDIRVVLGLPLIVLCLALLLTGCSPGAGSGFPSPNSAPTAISVSPSSAIVAEGSATTFAVTYTPAVPATGSLTWSVVPVTGGTITNGGVFTASATAGTYSIIATWTPSSGKTNAISGAATVEVLPAPQIGAELNPNFVQAWGGLQTYGTVQNGVVIGQPLPSVTSSDPNGNIQTRSGFTIPVACAGSTTDCE
jgi:hypothetical protein